MNSRDEIRDAMERLLSGTPQHTDGRLTRTNLALEAGVGRATLYRQPDLIAEWIRRVEDSDARETPVSAEATVSRLTRMLNDERQKRCRADRTVEGLAMIVAELYRKLESGDVRPNTHGGIIAISTKVATPRK